MFTHRLATTLVVASGLTAAGALTPSTAAAADYDIVQVWTYRQGDGFGAFGTTSLCARAGYPGTRLELPDTYPDEVEPANLGTDFVAMRIPRSDDTFLLRRYAERGEDCGVGVLEIRFADGTIWTTGRRVGGTPIPLAQGYPRSGTGRADRVYGSDRYGDALYGLGGNDRLYGYAGDDALDGGDGNDRLYGYAGDDVLFGGAGDDDLYGDAGDDTYVFQRGTGDDVIDDTSGVMRIFLTDHDNHEVSFRRAGDDLVIDLADGDRITVRDQYAGGAAILFIRLRNGFIDGDPLRPPAP